MKHAVIALFGTLLLLGCAKEDAPPIQIDVIAPSVTKQLTDKYGDAYIKTGKVEYDAEKNIYNVELFYKRDGAEKRYVMSMLRAYDSQRQLLQYTGEMPVELMGEASPHGRAYFPVTVDVMMNKWTPTIRLWHSRAHGRATPITSTEER